MNCCVYILASKQNGTLYRSNFQSQTTNISHKTNVIPGFTSKYNVKTLVYFESTDDMYAAIAREKVLKKWNRSWKLNLIESQNPEWRDLYDNL